MFVIGHKNYSSSPMRNWPVLRFRTYGGTLNSAPRDYVAAMLALPASVADAVAETKRIEAFEHDEQGGG